jgi:hypothetical protein
MLKYNPVSGENVPLIEKNQGMRIQSVFGRIEIRSFRRPTQFRLRQGVYQGEEMLLKSVDYCHLLHNDLRVVLAKIYK